ncbi:hypothetical protein [Cohnella sp. REN36]|uniref:hypothetical protein n=1 Tax=Cohnella sp. REN36 TaxID=2887347 RepID=UPI001D15D0CB|nr:hypothetical protein [Cohnella sp. REN36]MCC3374668.1 hypothetical protein [Cohnella sp. REN36]
MKKQPDALYELEWRSYRAYLPLDAKSGMYWAATFLAILAAALIFLRESVSIESVFAFGAILVALLSGFTSLFQSLAIWENGFREWWLTFPVPRRDLIRAKVRAAIRMQYYTAGSIWIVCCLYGLIRAAGGEGAEPIAADRLLGDWIAYGCLFAAIVPLCTMIGYALLGMYYGWRRWFLIPQFFVSLLPIMSFSLVSSASEDIQRWLRAETVFLYAGIALALAALLYRAVMAFVARYGMAELAKHRPGGHAAGSRGGRGTAVRSRLRVGHGFAALYALERARFRHFSSLRVVRILYVCAAALAGAGAYFAVRERESGLGMIQILLIFLVVVPPSILSTLTQHDANKRRIDWWLGLPYSRLSLLLARMAATWASIVIWMGGLVAAAAVGAALRGGGNFVATFDFGRDGMLLLYMAALYVGLGITVSCLLFGQSYSFRHKLVTWIYFPIVTGIYFVPMMIGKWMLDEEAMRSGVGMTHWLWLAVATAIAAPLAAICLRLGARWVHLYPFNTQEAGRRNRASRRAA